MPDAEARDLLGDLPAGVRAVLWDGSGAPPEGSGDVSFLVARYSAAALSADALALLPALRAIQLLSAGVEAWLGSVPAGVLLCNARGVHGSSTAELALAGMLSLLRELPRFEHAQLAHEWTHTDTDGLAGKQVLILGVGDIGRRIGAAVEVFDASATYVGRRVRDSVHGLAELPELLPHHDIVAVAIPHTPDTHHLIDAAFLAAMPDHALLVNIARGPIVDTDALLSELSARRLHAFLDVTEPEPLPADHALWDAPNLLITPHIGGGTHGWERRAYRLVREQIIRWHHGDRLENVVTEGY